MSECVFCKIVEGSVPCAKVWEDEQFLAFLDIRPTMEGMTLVIPKTHRQSYLFNESDDIISGIFAASRHVAKMLEKAFKVGRVAAVAEGAGVNHLHIKLYPMHGYAQGFTETFSKGLKYFEHYEGYISTQMGPEKTPEELQRTADLIIKE